MPRHLAAFADGTEFSDQQGYMWNYDKEYNDWVFVGVDSPNIDVQRTNADHRYHNLVECLDHRYCTMVSAAQMLSAKGYWNAND